MPDHSQGSWWRIAFIGLVVGWVVGMVWWVGFVIACGPSVVTEWDGGQFVERRRSVAEEAIWAPVWALPWAAVGFLVGGFTAQFRGYWIPATAVIGTIVGFVWCVATSPFDGWLAIMVPLSSLGGSFAGLIIGVPTRAIWGEIRGWDE
jgi:hypothetical protein